MARTLTHEAFLAPNTETRIVHPLPAMKAVAVRFECTLPEHVTLLEFSINGVFVSIPKEGFRLASIGGSRVGVHFGRVLVVPEGAAAEALFRNKTNVKVQMHMAITEKKPNITHTPKTKKPRAPRPPWRVGWSDDKRRFYFHTPKEGGIRMTFSGPRKAVERAVREHLPLFLGIARSSSLNSEFVTAIEREMQTLGLPLDVPEFTHAKLIEKIVSDHDEHESA